MPLLGMTQQRKSLNAANQTSNWSVLLAKTVYHNLIIVLSSQKLQDVM